MISEKIANQLFIDNKSDIIINKLKVIRYKNIIDKENVNTFIEDSSRNLEELFKLIEGVNNVDILKDNISN